MATVVGSAIAYLDLDTSNFTAGLKTAQQVAKQTESSLNTTFDSVLSNISVVGSKLSSIGTTMTAAITTPIVTAGTAIVKQAADYEQAIGGIETLFKESADTVIANSETAYERAGVSATGYMEQATKFSASLLQGLGNDTAAAAEYADLAIVDMSDNANKFGTNIEDIQNAYQGFAKQNYTMLDNLRLGYGGTQEEMIRLINDSGILNEEISSLDDVTFDQMILAIHTIQDEMGISGTTALEAATTISGSFGMAKNSIADFIAGLATEGSDMEQLTDNMIAAVLNFVNRIKQALLTIWDNLPVSDFTKWVGLITAAAGPILLVFGKIATAVSPAVKAISTFVTNVQHIVQAFNLAKAGFTTFASQTSVLGTALAGITAPMVAIVAAVGVLVAAFVSLYTTNEDFRNSVNSTFNQIKTTITTFVSEVRDRFSSLEINFTTVVETIKSVWETFCNAIAPVFEIAFGLVAEIVQTVTDVILGVIDTFIAVFQGDWKGAWEGVSDVVSSVFDLVLYVITNVVSQIILIISDWIVSMVKFAVSLGEQFLDAIVEWFQQIPTNVSNFIDSALDNVKQWATNMGNQAKETGTNFLNYIISFFTQLPSKIGNFLSSALSTATTWKSNLVNQAKEAGSNFLNNVISYIQQLPSKLSSLLNSAISALSSWVSNMGSKGREGSNSLISGVISAAANVGSQVASIGANIVSGVWQGIQNARSAFVSNVTSFFSGIVDSVKSALGISSPSKVFADEVGYWMPLGVSEGFQEEMPTAAKQIQAALNNSLDNLTTPDIATTLSMTTFTDTLTESLDYIATFYESIDTRLRNSIDSMTETLAYLIESGQLISDSTGNIGYVGANGFSSNVNSSSNVKDNTSNRTSSSGEGDTFIFYSNTSINEIEAARQLRNTKRDIAEGFY